MSTDQTPPPEEQRGARRELARRPRLSAEDRKRVRAELKKKYDGGASIRALAAEYGMSYGLTHTLLGEAGTVFRGRSRRRKADGQ